VFETVAELYKSGVHVEVTNLMIPGWNTDEKQIQDLVDRVSSVSRKIPFHFSRYYPAYKMTVAPTKPETLEKAARIAEKKLDYVYIGNIPSDRESTRCPKCGEIVIKRSGYNIEIRPHRHRILVAGKKWLKK